MYFAIFVLIVGGIIAFYANRIRKKKEAFADFLAAHPNFNPDYIYHTVLAVDTKSKQVLLSSNDSKYRLVDFRKISTVEKERVNNQYQILFVLKDFENPQVRMPFAMKADRDLWYDRIMVLGYEDAT